MSKNYIDVSVSTGKPTRVNVSTPANQQNIDVTRDTSAYNAEISKQWATSETLVLNEDYSSKYYANKSKSYAQNAESFEAAVRETYDNFINLSNETTEEITGLKQTSITEIEDIKSSSVADINANVNTGIADINNTVADGLTEINSTKTTILNDIEFVADGEKEEIKDLVDTSKDEIQELTNEIKDSAEDIINRVSLSMFDTILKDHVLSYEESRGLALQGTYVYKNAVAGSRYGYPDFYAKCLEEYDNSVLNKIYFPWTQPIATGETTAIDGGNMVITASNSHASFSPYMAMDGITSGTQPATGWGTNNTTAVQWWQVKFPYKIRIIGLTGYHRYDNTPANANTIGRFYTSSAKTTPIGNEYNNATATHWNAVSVTGIPTEGIVTDTIYFEKTGGGAYGGLGELKIEATYPTPLEVYRNPNGHAFYDIAQKDQIDEIFASTGMTWMYGIDQENERIFLPRNNFFEQATADSSEVGQSVEAGLPNIEGGDVYFPRNEDQSRGADGTGALYSKFLKGNTWDYSMGFGGDDEYDLMSVNMDASLSNPIYSNSDTVQPNAVKKLLYICVGNTVSDTSWVDVVTQVANGAKDIEDKRVQALNDLTNKENAGLSALSNASNALRQTQITNCLLEVPQNIKLELADGTLTLKAGSKVFVPNGAGVFEEVAISKDISINGRNLSDTIFYNAINKTLIVANQTNSGTTTPTGTVMWYDSSNNIIRKVNAGVVDTSFNCSFPLCKVGTDGTSWTSINQVFNGFGYIGSTEWRGKDIVGLFPWGKNDDGTLNNIQKKTTNITTRTFASNINITNGVMVLDSNGGHAIAHLVELDYTPSEAIRTSTGQRITWVLNTKENRVYEYKTATSKYQLKTSGLIKLATNVNIVNGVITSMTPCQTFKAVDQNEFNKSINTLSKAYITETYSNGTSWYRIWSDKWCEQGGYSNTGSGVATINFLKAFANTNYIILKTMNTTSTNNVQYCNVSFYSRTTTSAQTKTADVGYSWFAAGYIA